ncbi:hypothetical protein ACWD4N_26515 [Streptomyces sp. NPDC002586]
MADCQVFDALVQSAEARTYNEHVGARLRHTLDLWRDPTLGKKAPPGHSSRTFQRGFVIVSRP